jgi:hypothetical protein
MRRHAARFVARALSAYLVLCLVQWMFDGTAAWLANLPLAIFLGLLLTYMHWRWESLRVGSRPRG